MVSTMASGTRAHRGDVVDVGEHRDPGAVRIALHERRQDGLAADDDLLGARPDDGTVVAGALAASRSRRTRRRTEADVGLRPPARATTA